jgi:predicted TIM-barrel fold metal-dependent hydrolase
VLNSADCHLQEPANLWLDRFPAKMRDRAPCFEEAETYRTWIVDGRPVTNDPLLGTDLTGDVGARLREMDGDGIWAEAIFGSLGLYCLRLCDAELALACCRAYNDYLAETFRNHRDREVPIALIPVVDTDAAVAEIERVAELGLPGIALPMVPPVPYSDRRYDRVWAAAQEARLPVNVHFDDAGADIIEALGLGHDPDDPRTRRVLATSLPNLLTLVPQHFVATLVGSGILATYPGLTVVCVETNAGWLAPLMESMDFAWMVDGKVAWPRPLKPSEYVKRQIKVTFQDEPAPLKFLDVTGCEPLMWGSDFPHPEGTWPRSREITGMLFSGVQPEAREAILGGNMAKLYGLSCGSIKQEVAQSK